MNESQQVEWKSTWRDDYLRWICGFANAEGGTLVIGRDDNGAAVGVEGAGRLMEEIPNKVRDILGILVDVNLRTEDGKDLIEIRVEPYPSPISYKGEYFYRSGSTKQELKGAALERFLMRKRGRHWDDAPQPSFTARDCSATALALFKQRAVESGRMDRKILRDSRETVLGNLDRPRHRAAALRRRHGGPDADLPRQPGACTSGFGAGQANAGRNHGDAGRNAGRNRGDAGRNAGKNPGQAHRPATCQSTNDLG